MSLALSPKRTALMPGPWAKNDLWRKAKAVPSLDLRFAESKSLADAVTGQSLVTFTRASSGTYVDSDGLIKTAATNAPRFDHNPSTGESLGLLVEEARTNLLTYSEQFDNANWIKYQTTVTANAAVAPDGNTTADLLAENTSTDVHLCRTAYVITAQKTFSVFAKQSGRSIIQLFCSGTTDYANFDLGNGVLGVVSAGISATITALSNGWYRCSIYFPAVPDYVQVALCTSTSAGRGGSSYAGNGTSGIYLWGAQAEAGASPTSYIPTTTASVTRSADVASITGAGLLSFFNNAQGTFYAAAATSSSSASANQMIVSAGDGAAAANQITIYRSGASLLSIVSSAGVLQVNQNSGISAASYKFGFGYQANNFGFSVNANTAQTSSSGATPVVVNTLDIGKWHVSSSGYWNSTISRLTYWPQRLSNPTLQAITQ